MGVAITYKPLFTINIYSLYHLSVGDIQFESPDPEMTAAVRTKLLKGYNIHQLFNIEPTKKTIRDLKRYNLIFKKINTGFIIMTRAKKFNKALDDYQPFIAFNDKLNLTFFLNLLDGNFLNFSSLQLKPKKNFAYYYSNYSLSNQLVFPYLTSPIPVHANGIKYKVGDLVRIDKGRISINKRLFEAVADSENQAPKKVSKYWKQLVSKRKMYDGGHDELHYSTQQDLIQVTGPFYEIKLPDGDLTNKKIQLIDAFKDVDISSDIKNEAIKYEKSLICEKSLSTIKLDLRSIPPGKYKLRIINDSNIETSRFVYVLDQTERKPFVIMDIYTARHDIQQDFQLLDLDNKQKLKNPSFEVRYNNRSTYWRFLFDPEMDALMLKGLVDDDDNDQHHGKAKLRSEKAQFLVYNGMVKFEAKLNQNNKKIELPVPKVKVLEPLYSQHQYSTIKRVYSNIWISKISN